MTGLKQWTFLLRSGNELSVISGSDAVTNETCTVVQGADGESVTVYHAMVEACIVAPYESPDRPMARSFPGMRD